MIIKKMPFPLPFQTNNKSWIYLHCIPTITNRTRRDRTRRHRHPALRPVLSPARSPRKKSPKWRLCRIYRAWREPCRTQTVSPAKDCRNSAWTRPRKKNWDTWVKNSLNYIIILFNNCYDIVSLYKNRPNVYDCVCIEDGYTGTIGLVKEVVKFFTKIL